MGLVSISSCRNTHRQKGEHSESTLSLSTLPVELTIVAEGSINHLGLVTFQAIVLFLITKVQIKKGSHNKLLFFCNLKIPPRALCKIHLCRAEANCFVEVCSWSSVHFACNNLRFQYALHTIITPINRCQSLYSITKLRMRSPRFPLTFLMCVLTDLSECGCECVPVQSIKLYLKQGHVLPIVLLALFCGSITAIYEGAALLGVTVTWKKRDKHWF